MDSKSNFRRYLYIGLTLSGIAIADMSCYFKAREYNTSEVHAIVEREGIKAENALRLDASIISSHHYGKIPLHVEEQRRKYEFYHNLEIALTLLGGLMTSSLIPKDRKRRLSLEDISEEI